MFIKGEKYKRFQRIVLVAVIMLLLFGCAKKQIISNNKENVEGIVKENVEDIDSKINKEFELLDETLSKVSSCISREKKVNAHQKNESINDVESITFGKYEIDGNIENGLEDIEWVILDFDEKNQKTVLLSKYILDCKCYFDPIYLYLNELGGKTEVYNINDFYDWMVNFPEERFYNVRTKRIENDNGEKINWENSTLREWLNNDFYETCFNKYEKSLIDNVLNESIHGENLIITNDYVYVLSEKEAKKYLYYERNAQNVLAGTVGTAFANKIENFDDIKITMDKYYEPERSYSGLFCRTANWCKGMSDYWLRDIDETMAVKTILPQIKGRKIQTAISLFGGREPSQYDTIPYPTSRYIGVRPMITLNLNSENVSLNIKNIVDNPIKKIQFDERMFK